MKLSENDFKNYTAILREELIPAMGCTEPIAVAYAAAMTRKLLGEMPTRMTVNCSGNMIKNVKGVTVPNSGGQKGIEVAAILGMVGIRSWKSSPVSRMRIVRSAESLTRGRSVM